MKLRPLAKRGGGWLVEGGVEEGEGKGEEGLG